MMVSILRYMEKLLFCLIIFTFFFLVVFRYIDKLYPLTQLHFERFGKVPEKSGPIKVLFLTYARSGSTFLGELVNRNPQGYYYFEPLFGVYSHLYGLPFGMRTERLYTYVNSSRERYPTEFEAAYIAWHLHDLFNCKFDRLPIEVLLSPFRSNRFHDLELKAKKFTKCLKSDFKTRLPKLPKRRTRYRYLHKTRSYISYPDKCKKFISEKCQTSFNDKMEFYCFRKIFGKVQPRITSTIDHNYLKIDHEQLQFDNNYHLKPNLDLQMMHNAKDFVVHNKCLVTARMKANRCIQNLEKPCQNSTIIGAKVIRMRMENVAYLLALDPSIKIIHYVRDPRGILASRYFGKEKKEDVIKIASIEVCNKMLRDVEARTELEKLYPDNFMVLKYEDLATNSMTSLKTVYNFLNADVPSVLQDWLYNSTHYRASTNNRTKHTKALLGRMGTTRINSTKTAYKWREKLMPSTIEFITNYCWELLDVLNYTVLGEVS